MDSSSTKNHSINGALGGRFIFFVALCACLVSSPSAIAERIFNVQDYGATGDGITDDTQPIRDAIADAGAWADANTPEIATIYFPAGEYAVAPRTTDPQWSIIYAPAVFVVPTSNLKFLGDGHTQTKISCYTAGMKDPETHWTVTDNSYSKIQRGGAFAFARKTSLKNITFDGLRISGNADATGNADVGGEFRKVSVQAGRIVPSFALDWVNGTRVKFGQAQVALPAAIDPESYYYIVGSDGNAFGISETPDGSPVDLSGASSDEVFKIFNGDGWDMTHKAIFLQAGAWENIVVENCHLDRWRGEIIHGGGDAPRTLVVRNSILEHANSSVISVPSLILEDSIIRYGYNGIENYGRQSWHTSEIRRCQFIATPDRRFGETNAVVFIGMPTANAVFEDNTFINYKRGVLLSESANNVEIRRNDFMDVLTPVHIVRLVLYPEDPAGFDNIAIHNNHFRTTNGGGNVIYSQFGRISNRNFKIYDNVLHKGTESGTWKRLIQEFCWSSKEEREGYTISGNLINSQEDAYMKDSIRAIWINNTRGEKWKYGDRICLYNHNYDEAQPIVWRSISSDRATVSNFSDHSNFPVTISPDIWGKFPEGFTVTIDNEGDNSVALQVDPNWNNFSSPAIITKDEPITLIVNADGKFELIEAQTPSGENNVSTGGSEDPVETDPSSSTGTDSGETSNDSGAPDNSDTTGEPVGEGTNSGIEEEPVLEANHFWMFDDLSESVALDSGLASLDLDARSASVGEGMGSSNKGIQFAGDHAGVVIPNTVTLNEGIQKELTISLWVKQDAQSEKETTLIYEQGGYWRGLNIVVHRGWLQANGWNRPEAESDWSGTSLKGERLVSGEWNHIALVLNAGEQVVENGLKLYLNGELIASGAASQLWEQHDANGLGQIQDTTVYRGRQVRRLAPFQGSMDDVSIWPAAFTDEEIQDLIQLSVN